MNIASRMPLALDTSTALSISVFGPVIVTFDGSPIVLKTRKARALLGYLALCEARQETRERLVGLLWSESDEAKARASLRQTLRELRQAFSAVGCDLLDTPKLGVGITCADLQVDLLAALRHADAQRAHPQLLNVPRITDTLLEGLDDIDPAFRVWLLAKRQSVHDRLMHSLEEGLRDEMRSAGERRQLARALLNLDPTHEESCRHMMLACARGGDDAAALGLYKELWRVLDEEYGTEPSARTQQLVAAIKQGHIEAVPSPDTGGHLPNSLLPQPFDESRVARLRSAAPVRTPRKIALLVSQFQTNGVPPDRLHLVLGFRHHLIAALIRFREWSVVDDVAQAPDPARVAADAQYSIHATAYQIQDIASVVLTLRHNETNTFVWSESFELSLENWFDTQRRLIRRITTSLNVQLSTERLMRLSNEPDVSLEVYDRWLRGQEMIFSFEPHDWKRASEIFADVIRDAPGFSSSYNSLVQLNNTVHFAHPGIFRDLAKAQDTIALARKAVRLDPADFRAQLHYGWSLALAMQHVDAEVHMKLARELNENDPWTLISAAAFHAFAGDFDRAARLARESFALSPAPTRLHWGYQSIVQFLCGNYADSIEAGRHAHGIIKTLPAWQAAALHYLGQHEASAREGARFVNRIRTTWFGSVPPTDANIVAWMLHAHPIARIADWERLRDGLHHAGLPVEGRTHDRW
jgi:DNA-binding SARP family transcriptional activator/tetratricopeptide (TPR) repeat protein